MSPLRLAVAVLAACCAAPALGAQEPPRAGASRLALRLRFPDSLRLRPPPSLARWRLWPRPHPGIVAARWLREVESRAAEARRRRRLRRLLAAEPPPGPVTPDIPTPEEMAEQGPAAASPLGLLSRIGDIGLDLSAHLETRVDRLRNRRCSATQLNTPGCEGGFPTPSFDQQFRVRSGGVVSDRLHVNVDFDSEREFDANNNINVWYQGLPGEVVQRVEVGNVSFRTPTSRFITSAIPANSFGVLAQAEVGALEINTIAAQQEGSSLRSRTFTVGETATQPVAFESRDLDFEAGRFFLVVNPPDLPGYPAVDILELQPEQLPLDQQVREVRVYRLQAQSGRSGDNPNLGGIEAVAVRRDSPQRVGPFSWQLLVEGQDYYLDPSRLWFALARRVSDQEFLAVSYITGAGDTVGTFPAVNSRGDTLQLIFEPRRGPEVPTFFHELRNVYRVGGPETTRQTVALSIVVNESERPLSGGGTYLSRLGLAEITDEFTLDEFNRVFPRLRDPNGGLPIRDLFVVFPHLTPFADATRLEPGERADSLYRTPTFVLATQGPSPLFMLRFDYEATGAGDPATLSLGAFQVREGSERLFIRGRQLVRGEDYEIDYELGQVRFLNPDSLFVTPTAVEAQFEENQLFDIAPKNIFGFTSTYRFGPEQRLHAVALLQRDRSNFTRPQLGFEPESHVIGGLSTELTFRPDAVTRALDGLPLIDTDVPSTLDINAEVAISRPNPNQAGVAYVEDFQGVAALPVRLGEDEFQFGSAPASGRGVPPALLSAGGFDPLDAAALVWQNAVGTSQGTLEFAPEGIDSTLAFTGTGFQVEPVLWLTLKPDTVGGAPDPVTGRPRWLRPHTPGPRWRSISQPLGRGSGVGLDLSRTEFFEFWLLEDAERAARTAGVTLVFDFGSVFEDGVTPAPESFRVTGADTLFQGSRLIGEGRLDTEKDTVTNVFNAVVDDRGIGADFLPSIVNSTTGDVVDGVALCDRGGGVGVPVFPLGDLEANCTRRNGRLDTEDLNGDNRLDVTVGAAGENALRYVFPVGDDRYFVREGGTFVDSLGRTQTWRLYRIPFRRDTIQLGSPNLRQMQALRLTVAAPAEGPVEREFVVALARLRLVGAPWVKRAATPIPGLAGNRGVNRGQVTASIVGTENADLGYEPPPGVIDEAAQRGAQFEVGRQEINERSLRVLANDLRAGERAAAFIRFADEADRNFLKYRSLRVWARGRGAGWDEGDLTFFLKVGRNEDNFYLYRTPVRTETWEPEVVVDLDRWLELRARVEAAWLAGEPPSGSAECGGDAEAFVACDGPYVVHVRDPGIAPPNLARVSEVAVGMLRVQETGPIPEAELWVDDIRLDEAVNDVGVAAAVDVRLAAADVAEVHAAFRSRDDQFRQLGQAPSYVTDAATELGSLVHLGKFLPDAWGLRMPLNVEYRKSSADPFFVQRTDVRADALPRLRHPERTVTALELAVRRSERSERWLPHLLIDPVSLRFRRETGKNVTSLSSARTDNLQLSVEYNYRPEARTVAGAPGFLRRLIDGLPDWIKESEFGKGIRSSRLRLSPVQVRLASSLTDHVTRRSTFRVPVELPGDSAFRQLRSVVHTWRNELGIRLRPYSSLSLRVDYVSTRDLQDYGDSTTVGRLLTDDRRRLLGTDVGFERSRTLTTTLSVSPALTSWLRPRFTLTSRFGLFRDPNSRRPVREEGDTAGAFRIPTTLSNSHRREIGTTFDVARLIGGIADDSSTAANLTRGVLPVDFTYSVARQSSFDRSSFAPSLGFHLGLGGTGAFRERAGIPATGAGEQRSVALRGGTRLPLGARVRLGYRHGRNTFWSRRGGAQTEIVQRTREWPALSVSWLYDPRWGLRRVISRISAQLQYRANTNTSLQPIIGVAASEATGGALVRTENNTTLLSPSVSLTWVGGVTLAGRYTRGSGEAITSGNITETDRRDWGGNVRFTFALPRSLVRLRDRIQASLGFTSSKTAVCLQRPVDDACRVISDSRRRQLDVRLDTGFSEALRGGATFNYILTDQRHTSNRVSQVVFTIFADVNLFAGRL